MVFGAILAVFLAHIASLEALQFGRCSTSVVNPKEGLCLGTVFTYRVCTGDTPWYQITSEALDNKTMLATEDLGNFTNINCSMKVTETCASFLPQTSVSVRTLYSKR